MKKPPPAVTVLVAALIVLFFWGCAGSSQKTSYVKDGKEYGKVSGTFRHRWWSYYERGLSFLEGEFFEEARSDFETAIDQRQKDQRMARTYGMHFLDYFPHRELGITFFEMGNLDRARQEIETSLNQYPTAKAHHFLDRVRQALIQRKGAEIMPPDIRLDVSTAGIRTRDDPVLLSGVVQDQNYISSLSIHGLPVYLESSRQVVKFKEKLKLSRGRHTVEVRAENLGGKSARRSVVITIDREGPLMTLEALSRVQASTGNGYEIKGSVYDEAGVAYFALNGVAVDIKKAPEVFFAEVTVPVNKMLVLEARDHLGNKTLAQIPLRADILTGSKGFLAASDANLAGHLMASIFGPKDTQAPDINISDWKDKQTVYLEKIYVEGRISDKSKIVGLQINDLSVLRRKGRLIFFNHLVELQEGQNIITIKATDDSGNEALKKIIVHREIPLALKLDQRMSLSVMPFGQKGIISETGVALQDNLILSLINRNRFRLIERQLLDTILREQKLSRTKLVDRSTALKLGRLSAAQSIVTGNLVESRNGIEIFARLIDTETSEILVAEDAFSEDKNLTGIRFLADAMALKIHRKFPLVGGNILEKKGKFIFTDLGEAKVGIQKRLIVYREVPIVHPSTGKILGADNAILGRARVKQVDARMSKAELFDEAGQPVNRLDKVITE